MDFTDRLTLDAPRRTNDGYLVASVKVARTGIQIYSGREVDPDNKHGMRDRAQVRVYRPADEVFHKDSLASYAHRPVTIGHPPETVTSDNIKKYFAGITDGDVARDGEFVRTSIAVMDANAIRSVEAGTREISQGYKCDLEFGDGITDDGLAYDATQRNIRANHTAIVDMARGGPELKIGDSKSMKTILIDGHNVEVSDAAEIAVRNLDKRIADQAATIAAHATTDAKYATDMAAKDARIATLDAEVATLKAAQLTGDAMDAAVAARAKLVADAAKIGGEKMDLTGSNAEIKKRAVIAKLGDAYLTRDAAFFDAAFELQVVALGDAGADTLRDGIRSIPVVDAKTREAPRAAYMAMVKDMETASQPNAAKAH